MSVQRARVGFWLLPLLLGVLGCQLDARLQPRTQVVVDVTADEAVQAETRRVHLVVVGARGRTELSAAEARIERVIELGDERSPRWPLRIVLEPRELDARRRFMVTATALDAQDEQLTEARAQSGYVGGEVRRLGLQLTAACIGVSCDVAESCTDGRCSDAWQAPTELPLFVPDDASVTETGTIRDGAEGQTDAGRDGQARRDGGADGGGPLVNDAAVSLDDAGIVDVGTATPSTDPLPGEGPCPEDFRGCHVLAGCRLLAGKPTCGPCPTGYDDVRGDGSECRDIDECEVARGGCDLQHARCLNVPGGVECECAEGFSGDGRSCSDVDECAAEIDDCADVEGACVNDSGSYHCQCPAGYTGDGRGAAGCVDIDECAAAPNDQNDCAAAPAACVNTPGGFNCVCPPGYTGSARGAEGCADLDECETSTDDCADLPGACVNDVGSFHCQCPAGYTGDGRGEAGCVDVDECTAADFSGCDPMRACVNVPGTFECGACPPGYGTAGPSGCNLCACHQQGGDKACTSMSSSLPVAATSVLAGSRTFSAGTLFGYQLSLPANARVTNFGARKKSTGEPLFSMGLYQDDAGQPGARVARSDAVAFTDPQLTLPARSESTDCLLAGEYWLIGYAEGALGLGQDDSAGVVPSASARPTTGNRGLPLRWPGGGVTSEPILNMYVTFDQP
ncbi:MAG: EGF domain-containing protein [Polyangiales bacterium]